VKEQGDTVKAFLRATKKAMEEIAKDQPGAVAVLAKAVPETNQERELKVLKRTIPVWNSPDTKANGYGWHTEAGWQQTVQTTVSLKLVEKAPVVKDLFTAGYLK
jgi:ABC-type nitrate/sulfonate/bicarbonate transport system substrate-binding protein